MQTSIAQAVALTLHGNATFQKAPGADGPHFQEHNTTCQHCEFITFLDVLPGPPPQQTVYAANPHDWFERLGKDGVRSLRMCYGPSTAPAANMPSDRMLVAFVGGGGTWLIEARHPEGSDYWQSRWTLGDRQRKDRKIWRVSYLRILTNQPSQPLQPEFLEHLRPQLKQCLEEIARFSREQNLDPFTKLFEAGIAKLESKNPLDGFYHTDLAPAGFLSREAAQVLAAAETAWVFGGMGSWNDQGFLGETQKQYERLSDTLYRLLNLAIAAAASSKTLT
jgi:hypothetical protein